MRNKWQNVIIGKTYLEFPNTVDSLIRCRPALFPSCVVDVNPLFMTWRSSPELCPCIDIRADLYKPVLICLSQLMHTPLLNLYVKFMQCIVWLSHIVVIFIANSWEVGYWFFFHNLLQSSLIDIDRPARALFFLNVMVLLFELLVPIRVSYNTIVVPKAVHVIQ